MEILYLNTLKCKWLVSQLLNFMHHLLLFFIMKRHLQNKKSSRHLKHFFFSVWMVFFFVIAQPLLLLFVITSLIFAPTYYLVVINFKVFQMWPHHYDLSNCKAHLVRFFFVILVTFIGINETS